MKDINVGSVIYVAFDKKAQILPALVVEKIIREKPEGSEVSFGLQFSNGEPVQVVKQTENMFVSLESARENLISRLTKNIELVCNRAKESEKELLSFKNEVFPQALASDPQALASDKDFEDEAFLIDLPDGTKARVKLPEEMA